MAKRECGFLPVVESLSGRRVIGVVTDRDIALALGRQDRRASEVAVESCMTRQPKTATPEADLTDAAQVMEALAIHRLPVVQDGRLVGVLSLKDIALAARRQWARSGPNVAERQLTDILEAIAAARLPNEQARS
jgi:CBS domain-containing protein